MPAPDTQTKDLRHLIGYATKSANSVNEDDHSINFEISDDRIDHDGEVVEVAAVAAAIKEFSHNPVCLACHQDILSDGKAPVIGSWNTDTYRAYTHRSEMRLRFAVETRLGGEYWTLYSQRHMRAVSLGFAVIDGHQEVRAGKNVYVITKLMLIEISCVAVGANSRALAKLKALGCTDDHAGPEPTVSQLAAQLKQLTQEINERFDALTDEVEATKDLILPDSSEHAEALLGQPSDSSTDAGKTDPGQAEALQRINTNLQAIATKLHKE